MRYILAAALGTGLSAGTAQAVTYDLSYTVESEVTDYSYIDGGYGYPYPGPEVGDVVFFGFQIVVDPGVDYYRERLDTLYSFISYKDFDLNTGAINYSTMPNDDEFTEISLTADGTGSIFDIRHFNNSALVFAQISFDVLSWEVDGLPEIAPVPLPASLPLLGVGMAALGFAAHRRKAAGRS